MCDFVGQDLYDIHMIELLEFVICKSTWKQERFRDLPLFNPSHQGNEALNLVSSHHHKKPSYLNRTNNFEVNSNFTHELMNKNVNNMQSTTIHNFRDKIFNFNILEHILHVNPLWQHIHSYQTLTKIIWSYCCHKSSE